MQLLTCIPPLYRFWALLREESSLSFLFNFPRQYPVKYVNMIIVLYSILTIKNKLLKFSNNSLSVIFQFSEKIVTLPRILRNITTWTLNSITIPFLEMGKQNSWPEHNFCRITCNIIICLNNSVMAATQCGVCCPNGNGCNIPWVLGSIFSVGLLLLFTLLSVFGVCAPSGKPSQLPSAPLENWKTKNSGYWLEKFTLRRHLRKAQQCPK